MALFTDGTIARIEDLRAHESAVLDLASTEGIDVSAKLKVAQAELGTELLPFLRRGGSYGLSHVVTTDALVSAHAVRALAMIYRDLYQSRFNDRYEGKWREYTTQSRRAMRDLFDAGIGIAFSPVPQAPKPAMSAASGALLPARTYYVQIAWTRGFHASGGLSVAEAISLAPESKVRVEAPQLPSGITGWLVYAGTSPEETALQTEDGLEPGMSWTEPDGGLRSDLESWPVQTPDFYLEVRRELLRG